MPASTASPSSIDPVYRSLLGRTAIVLVLAAASTVACAPGTDEEVGGSQDSALATSSCGVTTADKDLAARLNYQMVGRFRGQLNGERLACARVIVKTTTGRGLGERAGQIALAAAMAESNLYNVSGAWDDDSYGLFQQRVSGGWGPKEKLVDPVYATNVFLDAMLKTPGWEALPVGAVAQRTQRASTSIKYDTQAADALALFDWIDGTSCPAGAGLTLGAIEAKYLSLGGCKSFLGAPSTTELRTAVGDGRYNVFQNGAIYWRGDLGAFEVHGPIRTVWGTLAWETGPLGFPISDVERTPDGVGSYSVFEGGSVYWSPRTGAHEVFGAIRAKWGELGWEGGALGYPTSGEYDVPEGRRSDFERGSITWVRATGEVLVAMH